MVSGIRCVVALLVLILGAGLGADAQAQAYPTKPVRMIVPFPAGGATDIIARLLSQKLQDIWGQNVVIDYKPGAGTVVGTDVVAKSPPDGYTLGMVITAHMINPSVRPNMPFDTLKDLSGVSMVAIAHLVLVATPSLPANNLAEVIALAKKSPGKLSYATPGTGTAMHLAGELLKVKTGIDIVHVPYRGGAPAYPDVITGRVPLMFDPLFASMENIKSHQVKTIAILSASRDPANPDIPTFAETLPGFVVMSISGIVVPSATPRPLVHKISADINKALQSSDLKQRMADVGMTPAGDTPEQFDELIASEIKKWAPVVKAAGLKMD